MKVNQTPLALRRHRERRGWREKKTERKKEKANSHLHTLWSDLHRRPSTPQTHFFILCTRNLNRTEQRAIKRDLTGFAKRVTPGRSRPIPWIANSVRNVYFQFNLKTQQWPLEDYCHLMGVATPPRNLNNDGIRHMAIVIPALLFRQELFVSASL